MIRQPLPPQNQPTTYTLSSTEMILLIESAIKSFIQYLENQNIKIKKTQDPQQNAIIINQKLKGKLTQIIISKNFKISEDRLNIFKRIVSIQQAVVLQMVLRNQFVEDNAKQLTSRKVKSFYVRLLEMFVWLETFKSKIITQKSEQNVDKQTQKALKLLQKISETQNQSLEKQRLTTFYLLKLLLQSNRSQVGVSNQFVKQWADKKKSFSALNPNKQQSAQIKEIIANYIRIEERAIEKEKIQKKCKKLLQQVNSRYNIKVEGIMKEIQRNFKYKNISVLRIVAHEINHHLDVFMTRFIRKVILLAKISNNRYDSKVEGDQFRYYSQNSQYVSNLFKRPSTVIQKLQKFIEQKPSETCIKAIKLTYPSKLEQYFRLRNSQQKQQLELYNAVKQSAIKQNKKLSAIQKYLFENEPQISDQIHQEEALPPSRRLKITRTMVMEIILQHYQWIFAAEAALYR